MISRLLKFLFWIGLLIASAALVLVAYYALSDRPQKISVEQKVLNVVDIVREDGTTPDPVIGLLDKLADKTEVIKGDIIVAPAPDAQAVAPYGLPVDHRGLKILVNRGYTVGYDDSLPSARWSSYRVFPYRDVHLPRPSGFFVDKRTGAKVATVEYVHSGYDRGHLAPNYAISVCYGEEAQRETFLLSNIVPQLHALNAGLWKDLELRIMKRYVERYGEVWVQVGPVLKNTPDAMVGRLPVPDAFWMVISEYEAEQHGLRAIAYLVPHNAIWRDKDLSHYVVSVRKIEALTGLDFFPKLPAKTQDLLETSPAPRAW